MQITIKIAAVVGALWDDRLDALWGIPTKTAIGNLQTKLTAKMQFQQAYSSLTIQNDC